MDKQKIINRSIANIYSLTPMQEGMLYHKIADKGSTSYIVQNTFELSRKVDEERIIHALKLVVKRYDVLRSSIVYEKLAVPRQVVLKNKEVEYEKIDLSELNKYEQNQKLAEIMQLDVERGFDLQNDSLIRVKYIILNDESCKMVWSFHHIIVDGWSLSLIYGNFIKYYNLLNEDKSVSDIEQIISEERNKSTEYSEYIKWIENQDKEAGLSYWEELLADYDEVAEIKPMIKPKPIEEQMIETGIKLSNELSKRLFDLAAACNCTINTLVETAWGVVLQKYSYTNDVVFGKVVSGRNANVIGIENIVGLFINTIPVRVKCGDDTTILELLKELQGQGADGNNYAYCSLSEIQGLTKQKAEMIKTLFVFENYYFDEKILNGKEDEFQLNFESKREQTNYSITLISNIEDGILRFKIMYNPNEYVEYEIQSILKRIESVLRAFCENPQGKISEIEAITEEEKVKVLSEFNSTYTDYPRDKTVVDLFEEQVRKTPENIAMVFEGQEITYEELNRRANHLAALLQNFGVKPDDFVVIMAEKSLEMIVGICGIIKAGGAYVPIDPAYPKDRIKFMLEDCEPKAVIVYNAEIETEIPVIDLKDNTIWEGTAQNPLKVNKPEDLVYCIYTSGTTGKPKGSIIEHKGVVRLVKDTNYIELNENSIILPTCSISFDVSTFEIWGALLNGGKLILVDSEVITNSQKLREYIIEYKANIMWLTTSLYNQMIQMDTGMFDSLEYLLIGGEKLSDEHIRILKDRNTSVKVIDGYGPTENTSLTTTYEIPNDFKMIPIGKPIANTKTYIINKGKLCGIGIPGELCMAGDGLARGYLNRPGLTSEKFVENPFIPGERMYCSGDLARWMPDGNIEYLGRMDEQVKIRGFRIELGEIKSNLMKIEAIKDAAVIAKEDDFGDKVICAYFVSDKELSISGIRDILSKSLTKYMIPTYIMQIESIPVNRSGKLDKRALPKIETKIDSEYIAPRNEIEETLCNIFSEVLGVERVGINNSFFEMGGDSIKAIRVVPKMRSAGYEISVKEIMNKYNVEAIANSVVASLKEESYHQNEVTGKVVATPIIRQFEEWKLKKPNHFNQEVMIEVNTDDEIKIRKALDALAIHHDIIRSVYRNNSLEILRVGESKLYDFKVFDFKEEGPNKIQDICTKLHSSIDLENGPLMKVALFKTKEGNNLFICLHHLVIDGVSLRILLEDFKTAMKQLEEGKNIVLPPKTASFKEWAEALEEYRNSMKLKKEKKYWENVTRDMKDARIDTDDIGEGRGSRNIVITLNEEDTKDLKYKAGKAFNTAINDLLISAIGISIKRLTGKERVSIGLEGHGREEIHKKIDIDRTVGWFTSIYPIVVKCIDDIQESVITTKEILRHIPNNGLGYGLLKDELEEIPASIFFNYLGQMDAEFKDSKTKFYSSGSRSAEENKTSGDISFNGYIAEDKLTFIIEYDRNKYTDETMKRLATLYKECLIESIRYCTRQKESSKTISDYSAINLTNSDLIKINERFGKEYVIEDICTLTPLQEGMLYHNIADKESTEYIIQSVYSLKGEVDEEKVKQALALLVMRYSTLRTAILHKKLLKPRQIVLKQRGVEYEKIDLSEYSESEQSKKVEEIAFHDVKRGFDLENDSLLRIKYIVLSNNSYKMIWSYHHIIIDGWCLAIIYSDFNKYYTWLKNGRSMSEMEQIVSNEKIQTGEYSDYTKWIEEQDREQGLSYWRKLLEDYDEIAEIKPMMKPEPTDKKVERKVLMLSNESTNKLLQVAASNNITLNTMTEAAWGIVLQKYNYTKDVVFGKVVSGRNADIKGIENIVGLFINTIPARVRLSGDVTALELLKEIQKQGTEGNNYFYCSLASIQEMVKQKNELIKVLYSFENYYVNQEKLTENRDELQFKFESAREQTNYALTLSVYIDNENLVFDMLYNPNEYTSEEIQSILAKVENVLYSFISNIEVKVSDIKVVTEEEKAKILGEFNNTYTKYQRDNTIVDLFEEQVRKAPDNIALVFENEEVSYRELNNRVNQLARKLRDMGVKPDDLVAIIAERSIEMIVGIYGVIKAGGAYVTIDPTYPSNRIRFILEDCKPKVAVIYKAEIESKIPIVNLADSNICEGESINLDKVNKPEDLAYVIYTSGTTGKPKGVMLEHKGVVAMRDYLINLYKMTDQDNVLQFANNVFDASVWEMTISLLVGARLTLISKDIILNVRNFNELVNRNRITVTLLPPQFYILSDISSLRVITTGGSASKPEIVRKAGNEIRYINAYGPSENTVLATHWEYDRKSVIPNTIPIGKPISNSQIYIINEMDICGIGIPGELCIAGEGLARGYLNRPELTAQKFIDNPFGKGKIYRTGDLARWLPDGNIEYLGRIDEQVKVRGFRIELGEIENELINIDYILDAAVITKENRNGDKDIYAYFISNEERSVADIKHKLRQTLPEYMIPAYILQIDKIPLTRSGKLDKKELPMPDFDILRMKNEFVEAQNRYEEEIMCVWKEVLNIDEIGTHDNFFDLGGNSLLITRMISQIEKYYPGYVSVGDVFANPTIERLAEHIESKNLQTMECTQITFPEAFFGQSNKGLQNNIISYREEGSLYQKIKALNDTNESELYGLLLFGYSYLIYSNTAQAEFMVNTANKNNYCSFDMTIEEGEDLNDLLEIIKYKYNVAPKFDKMNVRTVIKEKGLTPIFLYQFCGNDYHKEFYDFSISFSLEADFVRFSAEIFNKKISDKKIQNLLDEFIKIIKNIFE